MTRAPATGPTTGGADELYAELWPGLVRLGRLLTGSSAEGEDVAADAYLGLLRAWPVDNPVAYARRSVVNRAIDVTTRRRRTTTVADPPDSRQHSSDEPDDLWPLVQRLPPRQRAVVVLRYYLDLSEADIAAALGCRPGTVKSHASKALAHLRKEIS